jgi:hypothetical protein
MWVRKGGTFFLAGRFFSRRMLFPTDVRTNFLQLIKGEDFFPCRTFSFSPRIFCPHGRFVPPVVLLLDVLSLRTFCPPRHFVPSDVFSPGHFVPPDVFSHGRFVAGRSVAGHFVAGRFVWAPKMRLLTVLKGKIVCSTMNFFLCFSLHQVKI